MALVVYDADKAKASIDGMLPSGGYGGSGSGVGGSQTQIEKTQKKIRDLEEGLRTRKYLGLSNQGATCYMNSAI